MTDNQSGGRAEQPARIVPPFDCEHDALTALIDHDQSHDPGDPPCDRCLELDAIVTELRSRR